MNLKVRSCFLMILILRCFIKPHLPLCDSLAKPVVVAVASPESRIVGEGAKSEITILLIAVLQPQSVTVIFKSTQCLRLLIFIDVSLCLRSRG